MAVSTALNSIWLGLLLAALAAGLVRLLPRSNATTRHADLVYRAAAGRRDAPLLLLIPRPAPASAVSLRRRAASRWPFRLRRDGRYTWFWPGWRLRRILLARVAWSLHHIHGLKRRATLFGQRGNIRVLASAEVRVPMAAGFLRRAIVFPQSVLAQLSPEEFEQVLCHEMAHLRRWDDWTQLLQAVAQAAALLQPGDVLDRTPPENRTGNGLRRLGGFGDRRRPPVCRLPHAFA